MTVQEFGLVDLQKSGEAPDWLTPEGWATLSSGYLLPGETPRGMYWRVSNSAARYLGKPELARRFFECIDRNWLCLASPVASNLGTQDRGLAISCFGGAPADNLYSIFESFTETAMLSKHGGGTSKYWGLLRPRGSAISKGNGITDGIIPWLKVEEATLQSCSQGGVRRGSGAQYLDISSPEIEEFIDLRRNTGDPSRRCLSNNFHHGVCVDDDFMERCQNGDLRAQHIWKKILNSRLETGEPYIQFIDTANRLAPECYKANRLTIKASNLCMAGSTEVLTSEGPQRIEDMVGKNVMIFDGLRWVNNDSFICTQDAAEVLKIGFRDGSEMVVTPHHRFFIQGEEIKAQDLKVGDRLDFRSVKNFLTAGGYDRKPSFTQIVSIEKVEERIPVYCTNVPSTHSFLLANGILSGNCSEIQLSSDPDHSFVCCLSSLNLARWDEWKDSDLVEVSIQFLDAVMSEFIEKSRLIPGFEKAVRFAMKSRALGLGALGWHSLLQSKMIPWDSWEAMQLNNLIFKTIHDRAKETSAALAVEFGEPEWCRGFGQRNTHLMAVAPTVSNSLISGGVSQGIEPLVANYYSQKTAKGVFIRKNPELQRLLQSKDLDTFEVWEEINQAKGSVKTLTCLSAGEKEVFLTAREINQFSLVRQAAQRQHWIDQGQSLNLFFSIPDQSEENRRKLAQHIHDVHLEAYRLGLKGLYYLRSGAALTGDSVFRSDCKSCEA